MEKGRRFGKLTTIEFSHKSHSNKYFWKCLCDCGNTVSYRADALKLGRRKSCGCIISPKKEEYKKRIEKRLIDRSKRSGGCLEWLGRINPLGYGIFKIRSLEMKGLTTKKTKNSYFSCGVHRVAYKTWVGDIPEGNYVLHTCDNRKCIEPSHMFLGTHLDNMRDMKDKNRQNKRPGEKHHLTKFSDQDVINIRKLWDTGKFSQRELYERYKVSAACMCNIIRGNTWKHLL